MSLVVNVSDSLTTGKGTGSATKRNELSPESLTAPLTHILDFDERIIQAEIPV